MINSQYVTNALYGAYRLARADVGGLSYFDTSTTGFWRSFFAAVLIAPLFLILLIIRFSVDDIGAGPIRFYTIEAIAYVIGWVLFPLVAYYLVQTLEKEEQYVCFIVAYNWAAVLQNGFYLPFAILFQLGMIPGEAAGILNLILLGLVLVSLFSSVTMLQTVSHRIKMFFTKHFCHRPLLYLPQSYIH